MASHDFGQTLRELRHRRGLTQEEISRELHISRQIYSHYENGRRSPDAVTASRIARFHHITLQKLVMGLHTKETPKPDGWQEFLRLYDSLNPENQEKIRNYIKYLREGKA